MQPTHLLGPTELVCVFIEQVEGLRRALSLVHVACDEDPLHAHLQLPGPLPPLAVLTGRVALLAPFPGVVLHGGHIPDRLSSRCTIEIDSFEFSDSRLLCFRVSSSGVL